jgi:MFS family permease
VQVFRLFRELPPDTRKNLLILFGTALFFWTSLTLLLPTLPAYIEDLGGTTQQVGLVMGSFAIGLLLSRTYLGNLADRRSRKLVILIGTLVVGLAPLGYATMQAVVPLAAVRAFHGVSVAAFTTGYSALVVDLSPREQRGELIGYMTLAVPVGMAIGPAVGGFWAVSMGHGSLFLLSAALGGLALALASQLKNEGSIMQVSLAKGGKATISDRSFWQLLQTSSLLVPALILLLIGLLFGTLVSFLPLFMREIEVDLNAGIFYSAAAIASFATRVFAGKASDRFGRGLFITFSLICYGVSMVLLTLAHSPSEFLVAAALEGTGGGVLIPMVIALISDRSYPNERGRVYSICMGGFDVGIAIAGPILGAVAIELGYRSMFGMASSLAGLALILFLLRSNKTVAHSLGFAFGQDRDRHALDAR